MNVIDLKYFKVTSIGKWAVAISLMLTLAIDAHAKTIVSLEKALNQRSVVLENISGTGGSSGTVINGQLRNLTNRAIRIFVHLDQGLFLRNGGIGQNMISTEIYHSTGRYFVDRGKSFIMLNPNETTNIVMTSYCADFEKNNPTTQERFSFLGSIPQKFKSILRNIRAHREKNPNEDITVSAQTAVWLIQGYTVDDIRMKFSVSVTEAALAYSLVQ